MWTFMLLLLLLTAGLRAETFDNSAGGMLFKKCSDTESVSLIRSVRMDSNRLWRFECEPFMHMTSGCSWSSLFRLHQLELSYTCPPDHVITGVFSVYDPENEHRMWSFRCCSAPNLVTYECVESPKVNYWNEDFSWSVPGNNHLTGVHTHGKNREGDHRWSFTYCRGTKQDSQTINSQILRENAKLGNVFMEGDVLVPKTRSARVCPDCRWPKVGDQVQVPYTIGGSFSASERLTIENAMAGFHLSTCVRFVPRSSQWDYVSVVKKVGCWSLVGRTGGPQELSLGQNCVNNGIVQHELVHVLSFWHEQSRPDRDIYVTINYQNIDTDKQVNFHRLDDTDHLDVPYDYSSVMHYGRKDFSNNGEDTITPLLSSVSIGQRMGLSENDLLKINKLYGCDQYLHQHGEWDSQLDQSFTRQCPLGQAVSRIRSSYSSASRDRLWAISCKAFLVTQQCHWSAYVNQYWGSMDFDCGDDGVIAGVSGVYSWVMKDRRWKFFCCRDSALALSSLRQDPVVNYWGEAFSWTVASGNYVTGVKSWFDVMTSDRRWSFSYRLRTLG